MDRDITGQSTPRSETLNGSLRASWLSGHERTDRLPTERELYEMEWRAIQSVPSSELDCVREGYASRSGSLDDEARIQCWRSALYRRGIPEGPGDRDPSAESVLGRLLDADRARARLEAEESAWDPSGEEPSRPLRIARYELALARLHGPPHQEAQGEPHHRVRETKGERQRERREQDVQRGGTTVMEREYDTQAKTGTDIERGNEVLNRIDDMSQRLAGIQDELRSLRTELTPMPADHSGKDEEPAETATDRSESEDSLRTSRPSVLPENEGLPATDKQLGAIFGVGYRAGMDRDQLKEHIAERYGVEPDALTRSQASALIDELRGRADKG